jgi:hypothetical protein
VARSYLYQRFCGSVFKIGSILGTLFLVLKINSEFWNKPKRHKIISASLEHDLQTFAYSWKASWNKIVNLFETTWFSKKSQSTLDIKYLIKLVTFWIFIYPSSGRN